MRKKVFEMTAEEIEKEIAALEQSEAVALAKEADRKEQKRKKRLYHLRTLESRGLKLMETDAAPQCIKTF